MTGRNTDTIAALTTTAYPLTSDATYGEPGDWALAGIAAAYRAGLDSNTARIEYIRTDPAPAGELDLIRDTVHWLRDRDPDTLVTYNGEYHDIPVLQHRAGVASRETPRREPVIQSVLNDFVDETRHDDLYHAVSNTTGYVPLADALRQHGITPPTRPEIDDRELDEQDIPELAYRVVHGSDGDSFPVDRSALREYISNQVAPLFSLRGSIQKETQV